LMPHTILITGATDGIGLATAHTLVEQGHTVLLHGRNPAKLAATEKALSALPGSGRIETYLADLSRMADVTALARDIAQKHERLDVLINNAGIYRAPETLTPDGLDVRFAVNTLAPYLLTLRLLPLMDAKGRVINLSSAAQAPVDAEALAGRVRLADMAAYAQSKLALTTWSRHLALAHRPDGPVIVAVNPGSLLGTKMVKEGFGVEGGDIRIGADILVRAALSDEFASANGQYFDNDAHQFGAPHPDALNPDKSAQIVRALDAVLQSVLK
jgi:NAD(P)-dependent dehydrogenase (short-subunit alcohol dehydrogenase family)